MNKSTISKSFNTLFFDFLDDIINIYPENTNIKIAKEKFDFIRKANTTILIKFWKIHVYDCYSTQINQGDINFFLEKDYSADINKDTGIDKGFSNDKILSMIENVRETIRDMDDVNRAHSAKYIMNLSKLSELYASAT